MTAAPRSVFISFTPDDRAAADKVYAALEAKGFACWIAPAGLSPDETHQSVVRAVSNATDMVLVFSATSNSSDDTNRELALANSHHLTVIPVKIDAAVPNDHFAYELATRVWIDATQDWDGAMNQVAEQIGASGVATEHVAPVPLAQQPQYVPQPQPVAPPPPQVVYVPEPRRSHTFRNVMITLLVLILVIAGGGYAAYKYYTDKAAMAQIAYNNCTTETGDAEVIADCSVAISFIGIKPDLKAQALVSRGHAYLSQLNYTAAKSDLSDALAMLPTDVQHNPLRSSALYFRSVAERATGETQAANADLAQAVALGYKLPADATPPPATTPPATTPPTDTTPPADTSPPADTNPPADANPPDGDTPPADQPPADQPPSDSGGDSGQSPSGNTPPDQAPPSNDDTGGDQTQGQSPSH
jgi:TIR domain